MINNAGNLRDKYGNFRSFNTPQEGVDAMIKDITAKVSGNSPAMAARYGKNYTPSLSNLLSVYAPSNENDTANYIGFVAKNSGLDPNQPLTSADINKIVPQMIKMEQGKNADKYLQYAQNDTQANDGWVDIPDNNPLQKDDSSEWVDIPEGQPTPQAKAEWQPTFAEKSPLETFAQSLGQGASFGFLDEATAAALAPFYKEEGQSYGDAYSQMLKDAQASKEQSYAANPASAIGGELTGGIAGGITGGSALAKLLPSVSAGIAGSMATAPIKTSAGLGALQGAIYGAGASKEGERTGGAAVGAGVGAAGGAALAGAAKTISNVFKIGVPSVNSLNDAAIAHYKAAEELGGAIKPEGTSQIVENILKKVEPQTEILKEAAKNIRGANNPVDDAINMVSGLRGKPLTLNELDGIDGLLQEKISSNLLDKSAVRSLKTIQNEFRNASKNISAENLVNPEAFDAWRSGDALYSAKMKVQQINDIVKNAYNQQVPSTGIKTGFRQLARSIDKYGSQGWTPQEINAIRKAAKSGVVGGAVQALGGRLTGTIAGAAAGVGTGGVGSIVGVPAGLAASYPLRAAGNVLQKARATEVQRLVGNRPEVKSTLVKTAERFGRNIPKMTNNVDNIVTPQASNAAEIIAKEVASPSPAVTPQVVNNKVVATIQPEQSLPEVNFPTLNPTIAKRTSPTETGRATSLGQFIRNNGGMSDPLGEISGYDNKRLINKTGMHWDDMIRKAEQEGYLPEGSMLQDLLDALGNDSGKSAFRIKDIGRKATQQFDRQALNELDQEANRLGIDTAGKTPIKLNKEIIAAREAEKSYLQRELDIKGLKYLKDDTNERLNEILNGVYSHDIPFTQDETFNFDFSLGNLFKDQSGAVPESVTLNYRGTHKAPSPEDNAPLHDLTKVYPDDIYSNKASYYYGHGGDAKTKAMDNETLRIINSFRGKPDAELTLYRAVPKDASNEINMGDWTTINKNYAKSHGDGILDGNYKIISKKVKARDIYTNGDSIHEFGYYPQGDNPSITGSVKINPAITAGGLAYGAKELRERQKEKRKPLRIDIRKGNN